MVGSLSLKGPLDAWALEQALQALAERHEILRTCYPAGEDGEPRQSIQPAAPVPLRHVDLGAWTDGDPQAEAQRQVLLLARQPFALDTETPLRAVLCRLGAQEHVLGLSLHHIAGDGWSNGIVIQELFHLYEALRTQQPSRLPAMALQFADYAVWQRRWFDAGERERQLAYWRARLGTEHEALALPMKQARAAAQEAQEQRLEFTLPAALATRVRALGRAHGASLFMVMLALLKLVLYRFSGTRELRVGTPVANRQKAETHGLIGYFLNLLVLRTHRSRAGLRRAAGAGARGGAGRAGPPGPAVPPAGRGAAAGPPAGRSPAVPGQVHPAGRRLGRAPHRRPGDRHAGRLQRPGAFRPEPGLHRPAGRHRLRADLRP